MTQTRPSIFDSIGPNPDAELAKLREAAMKSEVRRLLRIEAKHLMQQKILAAMQDEGVDVDSLLDEPTDGQRPATTSEKAAATVGFVFSLPALLIKWTLYIGITWVFLVFFYGLFVGFE